MSNSDVKLQITKFWNFDWKIASDIRDIPILYVENINCWIVDFCDLCVNQSWDREYLKSFW